MAEIKSVNDPRDMLQEKAKAEAAEYKARLLTLPPEEILTEAYRYCTYQDILMCLDDLLYGIMDDDAVEALLKLPNPLGVIYNAWLNCDDYYMQELADCISAVAGGLVLSGR